MRKLNQNEFYCSPVTGCLTHFFTLVHSEPKARLEGLICQDIDCTTINKNTRKRNSKVKVSSRSNGN